MAIAVYLLCTLTSALCAALLLREYKRARHDCCSGVVCPSRAWR